MKTRGPIIIGITLLLGAGTAAAGVTTNYVAGHAVGAENGSDWVNAYTNIQDAIDHSLDGDVILIKQGEYGITNQLSIGAGTNLTIRGGYDGTTPLPGTRSDDPNLTIVQRTSGNLRILHIDNAGGWIEGLTFRNGFLGNSATVPGTGAYLDNATTVVTNCVIRDNVVSSHNADSYGAGMAIVGGSPLIVDCTIRDNLRNYSQPGAGLAIVNSSATIRRCLIQNNSITGNHGGNYDGAGIYANNAAATIESCVIRGNACVGGANRRGGGIYVTGAATLRVFNSLLAFNYASGGASGIDASTGNVSIENCTFKDNLGLAVLGGSGSSIVNTILWDHPSDIDGDVTNNVTHSIVQNPAIQGTGVKHENPVFEYGYYLAAGSPGIDAGSDPAANLGLDSLYAQASQTDNGTVDLGYHHAEGHTLTLPDLYVDAVQGDDGNAGTAPGFGNALKRITEALSRAQIGTTLHVAAGTYNVALGEVFPLVLDKHAVRILGAGAGKTVINPNTSSRRALNVFHVNEHSLIKDVELTGARIPRMDAQREFYAGAGMRIEMSSIRVEDCVISDNNHGGSWQRGGGAYIKRAKPSFRNCIITQNAAGTYGNPGGGVCVIAAAPSFVKCVISENATAGNAGTGAGVYLDSDSVARMENCLVIKNNSGGTSPGDGISAAGPIEIVNCTIADNLGEGVRGTAGTVIRNSIVLNDGVNLVDATAANVNYSLIGDETFNHEAGDGNLPYDTDPGFVDTTYYHLKSRNADYRDGYFSGGTWSQSDAYSPLIDAGDPVSDWSNEPDYPRGRINIGVYGNTSVASYGLLPAGTLMLLR